MKQIVLKTMDIAWRVLLVASLCALYETGRFLALLATRPLENDRDVTATSLLVLDRQQ